jgi:hypothetical protein
VDRDEDGAAPVDCRGADCNDGLPNVSPWAAETCDGLDNDCDGTIDSGRTCAQALPGGMDFDGASAPGWSLGSRWNLEDDAIVYTGAGDGNYHYARYGSYRFTPPYRIDVDLRRTRGSFEDPVGIIVGEGSSASDGYYVYLMRFTEHMVYEMGMRSSGAESPRTGHIRDTRIYGGTEHPNRLSVRHDGTQLTVFINRRETFSYTMRDGEGYLYLVAYDSSGGGGIQVGFDNVFASN